MKKKSFGFGKKNFGSDTDTEIGPWFRFPIPKPNFGRTLGDSELKKSHDNVWTKFGNCGYSVSWNCQDKYSKTWDIVGAVAMHSDSFACN